MESSTHSSHHPSLLLINEIEILFTQIRLMELYVKQAQTTTASEAARARARFQAELTALRDELKQKELALGNYQALARQADQNLRTQVEEIRGRLLESQQLLAARNSELEAARFEAGALRERIPELELIVQKTQASSEIEAIRSREAFQIELATLKTELARKEAALGALQAAHREAEKQLRAETQDLRAQLATKTDLLDNRTAELQSVRSETAALLQRIRQLELSGEQAEAAISEASGLREHLQTELVALRSKFEQKDSSLRENQALTRELEERLNTQLHDLQIQLAEKQELLETRGKEIGELTARTNELQEQISRLELAHQQTVATAQAAASALEDGFQARLKELEAGVSEKTELLQSHSVELQSTHLEIVALRQQIHQLELATAQAQAANNESNHLREALQHELSTVYSALEQKDASFEQQQAELKESGERLNAQVRDLQHQLSEKHQLLEARQGDLHQALAEIATQGKHISELEHLSRETQAAAAGEIERIRAEAQSELRASQTTLGEKERAFQEQQAAGAAFAAALDGQIQDLRNQVKQKQELLEQRDRQLETASSETGPLRDRMAQLESIAHEAETAAAAEVARMSTGFQAQSAALQAQLDEKAQALAENQVFVREVESRLQAQIRELQGQLAERQLLIETRNSEISGLESKLATLSEQLVYFESASQKAVLATAQEAELARRALEAELSARQETLRNIEQALTDRQTQFNELQQTSDAQLHELRNQLTEKQAQLNDRTKEISDLTARTHDLQEEIAHLELAKSQTVEAAQATASELEQGFRDRVAELEAALSEQKELLRSRTAELELNAAQADAAASETARIRLDFQDELALLRSELEQKETALQHTESVARERAERLDIQVLALQTQLAEKQARLDDRTKEVGNLTAKTTDLQEHIAGLETANRQTAEAAQAAASELEQGFRDRVAELEAKVSEKGQLLENRTAELQNSQSETAALQQRICELELASEKTQAAATEAAQIRESLQTELMALRTEIERRDSSLHKNQAAARAAEDRLLGQLRDLQAEVAEKQEQLEARRQEMSEFAARTHDLQEQIARLELANKQTVETAQSTASELEHGFRARVAELEASVSEKTEFLQNRTAELESAKFEHAALMQRIQELEVTGEQAEAAKNEAKRLREILQNELSNVHGALQQRDASLQQQQAEFRESSGNLNAQVHDLRCQLAEKDSLLETRAREVGELTATTSELREQIVRLELAHHQTVATVQSTASELEHGFRAHVAELEATVFEKEELLRNRTAELESIRSETATLIQRTHQLELAGAQADAAANEAARIRQHLQDELVVLRTAFEQKDAALQENEAVARELKERLDIQVGDLQTELAEKQEQLEARRQEMSEFAARTHDLQEQIARLELANKQTVETAQSTASELEHGFRARVAELEASVSEKTKFLQNRTAELQNAQSEITALQQRIHQLELTGEKHQAAATEAAQMRESLQAELIALRTEIERKDSSLQENQVAARAAEDRLHEQLRDLQGQLAEQCHVGESREDTLRNATSEITALHEQVLQLESARAAAEKSASLDIQRVTEQYHTELGSLRAYVEETTLTMEERRRTTQAFEQKLNDETRRLEGQLVEKQILLDQSIADLQGTRSKLSALRERASQLEVARKQSEMLAAAQAEQIRERVKAEVGALDAQLAEKENDLKILENRSRDLEAVFNTQLDELHVHLTEKQLLIDGHDIEMADVRAQIAALLEQITRLEHDNKQALEQQWAAASGLEQGLFDRIEALQTQLAEKSTTVDAREGEIRNLESEIKGLTERLALSEVAIKEAQAKAAADMEQMREHSQAELAALQSELDRQVQRLQKREAIVYSTEQSLQVEINSLRAEIKEKHGLLQSRNDELLRVKAEMDALQERIVYLESAARQAELERVHEPKGIAENARTELDSKERILEERQAAVNGMEEGFRTQIDNLRNELAEKQALLDNPGTDFLLGKPTLTETQRQKLIRLEQLVENIKADNEQTLGLPNNRRWRFTLSRKRRWK